MHDVFVSFSSKDIAFTQEFVSFLSKNGLSSWVSWRPGDLPAGADYMRDIPLALDRSRAFVFLISRNSISSSDTLQELSMANARQKNGLRIFPVIIDPELQDDYPGLSAIEYVFTNKQIIRWHNDAGRQSLLQRILPFSSCGKKLTLVSILPEHISLIGRDDDHHSLADKLAQYHQLQLIGQHGNGKTAFLRAFCHQPFVQSQYRTIIFLPVGFSLTAALSSAELFPMDYDDMRQKQKSMSESEYALLCLASLERSVSPDTLVIVDSVDPSDPLLPRLCNLNCHLILCTLPSEQPPLFGSARLYELKNLDPQYFPRLFEHYYGEQLPKEESRALNKLLREFQTPLSIELIAKQLRYLQKRPSAYNNNAQLLAERQQYLNELLPHYSSETRDVYRTMANIWDSTSLSGEEVHLLKVLCVMPVIGVQIRILAEICGSQIVPAVKRLESLGFVQLSQGQTVVSMPTTLRDIVSMKFDISLRDPDIRTFFSRFIPLIANAYNKIYDDIIKFKGIAQALYYHLPQPTLEYYRAYSELSSYLWTANCHETSLELQARIRELFIDTSYYAEAGEAHLLQGITYQSAGRMKEAQAMFEESVKLLSNRYASALSYLAQAKMANGVSFSKVEPLFKRSVSLRKTYYPASRSLAAALHQYAKALSHCDEQERLIKARCLEEQAAHLFSTLEPDTPNVNLTSTELVLGWLDFLEASSQPQIDAAIERLENAAQLRILFRGKDHPWMEDAYLKLSKIHALAGSAEKAAFYYDALLSLQEVKYGIHSPEVEATKKAISSLKNRSSL